MNTVTNTERDRLFAWYGDRYLYIPMSVDRASEIVSLIGVVATQRLINRYGGMRLRISESAESLVSKKARIAEVLRCNGKRTIFEIAAACECTPRYVLMVKEEMAHGR